MSSSATIVLKDDGKKIDFETTITVTNSVSQMLKETRLQKLVSSIAAIIHDYNQEE